jgi:hypothetical protein
VSDNIVITRCACGELNPLEANIQEFFAGFVGTFHHTNDKGDLEGPRVPFLGRILIVGTHSVP